MKKFSLIALVTGFCLFCSCVQEVVSTDTWECSVELSSSGASGNAPTTTAKGGICLVKGGKQNFGKPDEAGEGGDDLQVEIYSSHSELTVSSCQLDILRGEQLGKAGLAGGAGLSFNNGVAKIPISSALMANNIDESKPCTFKITLKDGRSGQEREFVKTFYVYKHFWLQIVPMTPNSEAPGSFIPYVGTGAAPVYGGETFCYELHSNQKELYIKEVDFSVNKDADIDNRLVPGQRVTLVKSTAGNSSYYAKSFVIPSPQIEQDKPDEQFIITAFGEDYDTSIEETASVKIHRYMETTLEVFVSRSADPYEMDARNHLELERPVYLHILTNRFSDISNPGGSQQGESGGEGTNPDEGVVAAEAGITCTSLQSTPNVTNAYKEQIHWFRELISSDSATEIRNTGGQAIYPSDGSTTVLIGKNVPNGYEFPTPPDKPWEIKIDLHTEIPPKTWPFVIHYDVIKKQDVGPSQLAFAEYKILDKNGNLLSSASAATVSDLKINEGQFLAARLDKIDSRADGDIQAVLENTTDGAVDFCFAKYNSSDNSWTPLAPKEKANNDPELFDNPDLYFSNYTKAVSGSAKISVQRATNTSANESVWLLCRGLDRGGNTSVKIQGSIPDRQENYASASFGFFVRHKAAIFMGGSAYYKCKKDIRGTGGAKWEGKEIGWLGYLTSLEFKIYSYRYSSSVIPDSKDDLDEWSSFGNMSNLVLTTPQQPLSTTKDCITVTVETGGYYLPTFYGPNKDNFGEGNAYLGLVCDYSRGGEWRDPYYHSESAWGTAPTTASFTCYPKSNFVFNGSSPLSHLNYWDCNVWYIKYLNWVQGGTTDISDYTMPAKIKISNVYIPSLDDYEITRFVDMFCCSNASSYGASGEPWWCQREQRQHNRVNAVPENKR